MFNDLILDKMKKVFEYIATLLLLLAVGTSCEEGNDNWKVITAVPTCILRVMLQFIVRLPLPLN